MFRSYRQGTRPLISRLRMLPLEDRIVPAAVDPALFQAMRTVVADLNGDGVPDLLATGFTSAGISNVRAVNGVDGSTLFSITPFPGFTGPLSIAAGDVNGDGTPDIAIGAGFGGGPRVQIYDGASHKAIFDQFAYDPTFRGGVSVALGDVTGDGRADLVTAAGYGGGPHIKVFDGMTLKVTAQFFAYDASYRDGVSVSVGDLDGDGVDEIVTGTGPGGGAHIRIFSGKTFALMNQFFSADTSLRSGSQVAVGDIDGNGLADIVTISNGRIRAYEGLNATPFLDIPANGALSASIGDLAGDGFGEVLASDATQVIGYGGAALAPTGFVWTAASTGGFAKAAPALPVSAYSGEAIYVPGIGTGTIQANRLRSYTTNGNEVGIFAVADATGKIGTLSPGDAGYLAAALAIGQPLFANSGPASAMLSVPAGHYYGMYVTSGTTTLTSFSAANPGGASQFRFLPGNRFAVEDGANAGDRDFNDSIGQLTVNGATTPPSPPVTPPVPPSPPVTPPSPPVTPPSPPVTPPSPPVTPPVPPVPPTSGGNIPSTLGTTITGGGGDPGTATVGSDNTLTLAENASFRVAASEPFTIPSTPTAVMVTFDTPNFDTTAQGMIRDAFEVAVLGADGSPLALPIAANRDASFNISEGLPAVTAPGTTATANTVTINLSSLPAGTPAELVLRLDNNDTDDGTTVRITRIDFIAATSSAPSGVTPPTLPPSAGSVDFSTVSDVTPSVKAEYGRTTLTEQNSILTTDLSLSNTGTYPITGRVLAVITNLSDPSVGVLGADGVTPSGQPYYDLTNYISGGVLEPGAASNARTIQFSNPNLERFTYSVQVLAGLNHPPAFTSSPVKTVEVGQGYAYTATAVDPDAGQTLTYSLLGGPTGMNIDPATGLLTWTPSLADVGSQNVHLRVTDPLGGTADQTFTISVVANLPNRPPVITSTPNTAATVAGAFDVTTIPTGSDPTSIAAGNFGSGLTAVTANAGEANVSLDSTTGTTPVSVGDPPPSGLLFQQGSNVNVGLPAFDGYYSYNSIAGFDQADFNGDGIPDFVSSNYTNSSSGVQQRFLSVVLGHGDGTFESPIELPVPATLNTPDNVTSVIAKDFDGDGKVDILAFDTFQYSGPSTMLFWHGNGDGTFAAPTVTPLAERIGRAQAADFNGDGKLDLVVTNLDQSNGAAYRAGTLLGNGDGTFGAYTEFFNQPGATLWHGVALGDLNGDGKTDIVLIDQQSRMLHVYLNDGAGNFTDNAANLATVAPYYDNTTVADVTAAWIGDFDGDGTADILYATAFGGPAGLGLWKGSGDGATFTRADAATNIPAQAVNEVGDGMAVDLNGDGKLDVVFGANTNSYSAAVVALNNGDGTFTVTTYQDSAADRSPSPQNYVSDLGAVVGDFNRDGILDVALPSTTDGDTSFSGVSVFFGQTPGTLAAPEDIIASTSTAPLSPVLSQLGDLNGDGIPDLVTVSNDTFFTQLGHGDGTFGPAIQATPPENGINAFYLVDLNHDGKLDLVWSGGLNGSNSNSGDGAALGNGDGTFTVTWFSTIPGNFYGATMIAPVDFNGDGYLDFADHFGSAYSIGTTNEVWLQDPAHPGTFNLGYRYTFPAEENGNNGDYVLGTLVSADFDGDGKADLLDIDGYEDATTPRRIQFFRGNGDGTFADPVEQSVFTANTDISQLQGAAVADLNGDGIMDLVVNSAYSRVDVFLGNGDGTFGTPTEYATTARQLYLKDVNGDGRLDLVAIDNFTGRNQIAIRLGNGDGTFGQETDYSVGGYLGGLAFGDENIDGIPDIAAVDEQAGRSATTFFLGASPGVTAATTADINGDGKTDTIAIDTEMSHVKILLGNGDDTFARQNDIVVGRNPIALAALDLDGDGDTDIVTANKAGRSVTVLTNDGTGNFTRNDINVGVFLSAMATGELTGDGKPDVVVASATAQSLYLLANNGVSLDAPIAIPLGDVPGQIAIGDATGDGINDIVVSLPQSKRLMILPGNGDGSFGAPLYVQLDSAAGGIGIADFNQDGKPDIAITLPEENKAAILFGRGDGRFAKPQTIGVGKNPTSLTIKDMNGDGRPDILVANSGDNTASEIINHYDPTNLYRYQITATDPDGDPVSFALTDGPGGMLFDAATGQVTWAPTADQIGLNSVTITASDGKGGTATQSFQIAVAPARNNAPPVIYSTAPATLDATKAYFYTPTSIDPDGDSLRYSLVNGPAGATVDPITGQVTWDPRGGATVLSDTATGRTINVPITPSLITPSITVDGYFRFDDTTRGMALFNKNSYFYPVSGGYGSLTAFNLVYYAGQLSATIGGFDDSTGTAEQFSTSAAWTPQVGQWYHFAYTFDDATGTLSVFVDGKLLIQQAYALHLDLDTTPLVIGDGYNQAFVGAVAQFQIWNYARSAAEIQSGIDAESAADAPGLVLYYRFNDGAALTVRDDSPYANNGRLIINGVLPLPLPATGLAFEQTQYFTIQVEDGKGGVTTQSFGVNVVPPETQSITGTVYSDDNGDGSQDGNEAGIANAIVYIDANGNGVRDADETFTRTDSQGNYSFDGELAGSYAIAVEPLSGYAAAPVQDAAVTPFAGADTSFGLIPQSGPSISGQVLNAANGLAAVQWPVYLDENSNGVHDAGEPETLTDASGNYAFTGLYANNWHVRLDNPAGWTTTTPSSGHYDINLPANGDSAGNDFVIVPNATAASQPRFVTTPQDFATAREPYRFATVAIDPGYRPLTYSLQAAPAGMTVDPQMGVIVWTPKLDEVGTQTVILKAANDRGGVAIQDFTTDVSPPNSDPVITSTAPSSTEADAAFEYDVLAQDAEQTSLAYSMTTAPSGASIDAVGHITWTPNDADVGVQQFTVQVSDRQGGFAYQSFALTVIPSQADQNPAFTGSLRATASVSIPYFAKLAASDPDGDLLTFALVSGPTGMSVDPSGEIMWTPTAAQFGSNAVSVSVSDGRSGSAIDDFTINVGSTFTNSAPVITSTPGNFAVAGTEYRYDIAATDADNDPISYQLVSGPSGLSLDPQHGTVRWNPATDQFGQASVTVRALDPFGGVAEQNFVISVRAVGGPPAITSVPPTQGAVGVSFLYSVFASSPQNDPLAFSLLASPSGMTINAVTGELAWTPTVGNIGSQQVIIQVSDGTGNFATQGFAIDVLAGLPNQPPIISSTPPSEASAGTPYTYNIAATDPEGTQITYLLRQGPAGMTVDPATGAVTWNPTAADIGTVVVAFAAEDAGGAAAVQSFELEVLPANVPPVIQSTPPNSIPARGTFRYDVLASDANLDPIAFELLAAPAGMTIDPFGRITWATDITDLGVHTVTVQVHDPRGGTDEQTFILDVVPDTTPPHVTVIVGQSIVRANSPEIYAEYGLTSYPTDTIHISAVDDVGVASLVVTANGKPISLDAFGNAVFSYKDWGFGTVTIVAKALDAAGNQGTGASAFAFLPFGDDPATTQFANPTAIITSPGDGGSGTGFVNVMGSASSDNFTGYTLSYSVGDSQNFITIATGTTAITNATLGTWDTTMLQDNQYTLRLDVQDEIFGTTTYEESVGVSGNFKLGNFRLSFTDLTIPVAGIPIALTRTYDSLQSTVDGDLGFGWSLDFRDANLQTGLAKTGLEDLGFYSAFKPGTKVYVTLPGGTREGFTFTPNIGGLSLNLLYATPQFTPDPGVKDTLSVQGGTYLLNADGDLVGADGEPYNPAAPEFGGGYTITTPAGEVYKIDGNTGLLTSATDRNGNTLSFTDSGISGSGVNVTFEKDAHGRITEVIDPAGNTVKYAYDSQGNLVSVTDRDGNVTQFTYKSWPAHYLDSVIDPLGRTGIRTNYDANGRLIGTTSANGGTSRIVYDPDDQMVTTQDALGNTTTDIYDAEGNIVSTTDGLGRTSYFTYDSDNRTLTRTDGAGNVVQSAYDAAGNETVRTDAMGNSTDFTYGAFGEILSETNPLGETTQYTYDSDGDQTSVTDPLGNVTRYTYDAQGLQTSVTDAAGNTTTRQYDDAGHNTAVTYPDGATIDSTYDADGNPIGTSRVVTLAGVPQTITTSATYDADGRETSSTDADGFTTQTAYTATGNIAMTEDPLGRKTTYDYAADGSSVTMTLPDGSTSTREMNALGQMTSETTAGVTISTTYDAAGEATALVLPDATPNDPADNPSTSVQYDDAGRPVAVTGPSGVQSQLTYDAFGLVTATATSTGTVASNTYDAAGHLTSQTDALGNTTTFTYDADGRVISVTAPNGGVTTGQYDSRGDLISLTDPLGRVTRREYDSVGRLTAVIDPMNGRTEYTYDEMGDLIQQRDADGNITNYEYDARGLRTAIISPLGQRQTFEYDAAGQLIAQTNADGETIHFAYDSLGRMIEKDLPGNDVTTMTYDSHGSLASVTDSSGTTTYQNDSMGRLLVQTNPDGRSIAYTYDSAGHILSVTTPAGTTSYTWDSNGRMQSVTDLSGGVTTYRYDAAGDLIDTRRPDGTDETRTYDSLGDVTEILTTNLSGTLSDLRYTYDLAARVTEYDQVGISTETYQYDALDRITSDTTVSATLGTSITTDTYDAVGNRLTVTDSGGTTVDAYDANGRLLTSTEGSNVTTYSYDAAGRLIGENTDPQDHAFYTWSADDRLLAASVTKAGTTTNVSYTYDANGIMVSRTQDSTTTRFLVDSQRSVPDVVEEYTPGGILLASYSYGYDRISIATSAGRSYYHADRLGTTLFLTNGSGTIQVSDSYNTSGGVTASSGPAQPYLFTGERSDPVTGFEYLRARFYDPASGRFISVDPILGSTDNPISLQRYLYANDSPTNATDPTGMDSLVESLTVFAVASSLLAIGQGAISYVHNDLYGSKVEWDGVTAIGTASLGLPKSSNASVSAGYGIGGSVLTSHPNYNHKFTVAVDLLFVASVQANIIGPVASGIKNNLGRILGISFGAATAVDPNLAVAGLGVGLSYLANFLPFDVTYGSTTLYTSNTFKAGVAPSGASFTGGFLTLGGGFTAGAGGLPTLNFSTGDSSSSFGASVVIQGFGLGYSLPDRSFTLKPSLGFGATAGLSIPVYWESYDDLPDPRGGTH